MKFGIAFEKCDRNFFIRTYGRCTVWHGHGHGHCTVDVYSHKMGQKCILSSPVTIFPFLVGAQKQGKVPFQAVKTTEFRITFYYLKKI